ncbi:ATP-binding sensor histidine kinase [Sorangium sp. So ce726]|uniref:AAA family ATPase n=1 Tax=Sorangium sp. So ce726 TaxID=3133319 RepID=UPI003F612F8E
MTSPSPPFPYTISETIYEGRGTAVYRAVRNADGHPVVLKVLDPRSCRPKDLARLKREYETGKMLDVGAVVRPLALEMYDGALALVMEDSGAEPLDRLLGAPMAIGRFLELAIRIADAVSDIHQRGVVHRDLKPANILVIAATGEVKIADLALASRLSREQHDDAEPAGLIEGSLPYMSPEQTGRMNRGIDSRSDLYSLGVTFYQMLTGKLPFDARDPLEWIHCHVARAFAAPSEVVPEVPEAVERIVIKLLAKMPEERYQTARGLGHDLKRCFESWRGGASVAAFPLGEQDASGRMQIPQKLYGRDEAVAVLLRAFERMVDTGTPELVLVSGYSGIGKSTLVHELDKPVARERGFSASGKFDQHKRDIPYSTIVQAVQEIVLELLADSEKIAAWKQRLLEVLTINGQLIVDLIPQLELVIGPQPPAPDLPPVEAQNRFRIVFRHFIGVFARKEHPLVLFLDDLQWADSASLALLQDLVTHLDMGHLLVIGAYRDNEVTPSHPLMTALDEVRREGARVRDIVLGPLSREHLSMLVSDMLQCRPEDAAPLSALVHEKTAGNPFFSIQFLLALHEEQLIELDPHTGAFRWDMAKIRAKGFTDNVVDLMVDKLARLPASTQEALKQLACLGNAAEVGVLTIACDRSEEALQADVWQAILAGLVLCHEGTYKFLHDRVQEAAYSLIPAARRAAVHLEIGRRLVAHLPSGAVEERAFDVATQLNHGAHLITDPREREALCRLNLLAGIKARASVAYASARNYLAQATSLLPPDAWSARYEDTFRLYMELAECESIAGNFQPADELFDLILQNARSRPDRVRAHRLRMRLYQIAGRHRDAVAVMNDALRLYGATLPDADEEIQAAMEAEIRQVPIFLRGRRIPDLVDAPVATDEDVRVFIALVAESCPLVYGVRPALWPLLTAKGVNASLQHGHAEESSFVYSCYAGVMASILGDVPRAFQFSEMALKLNEKFKSVTAVLKGRLLFHHAGIVNIWHRHYATSIPLMDKAFRDCLEVGDFILAGYLTYNMVWVVLENGDPLDHVIDVARKYTAFARQTHNDVVYHMVRLEEQLAASLKGATRAPTSFSSGAFDEASSLAAFEKAGFSLGIAAYHIMKQVAAFTHERHAEALESAASAALMQDQVASLAIEAAHHFYHALTVTALSPQTPQAPAEQRQRFTQAIEKPLQKLRRWAANCPENFRSRYALVSAEVARIEGRDLDAMRLYEEAIRAARESGFVHIEALAYELASRFYRARGFERFSDTYLCEARSCYVRWGADGKVKQLEQLYPQLVERRPLAPTATFAARTELLDVLAVVKASQTISGEILFEKLLRTLLEFVLEQGGAQKGCLVLVRDGELTIEAEAAIEERQGTVTRVLQSLPVSSSPLLPASLLHYVRLTKERVLLDDAAAKAGRFSGDEYIVRHTPRSVLCVPILRQAEVLGLLYLENNVTTHAFTPDRLLALELLATQAAISLENALLLAREREARAAAEAAERRTAFLAHELKTPLTGLHLKLDALARSIKQQETVSSSWLSSSLTSFKRQLGRLNLLIDSLLDLSRVQKGRLALTREPVDLAALVRDVVGRLSEQAELAGCALHVQAERAVVGQWDRLRLEQVVTNLLTNAMKYGAGKPVRIVTDGDGAVARLTVSDQGIGISEADQRRVFEAFERATGLHQAQSLGLGLYLVREIVRAHGGRVELQSRLGSGTTFLVELPVEPEGELGLAQPS